MGAGGQESGAGSRPRSGQTIAAIATPFGTAGIGVIRISGPEALAVASRVLTCKSGADVADLASHTVHLGDVAAGAAEVVDEALITVFSAPHSYTGEDVVEVSCHGGTVVLRRVLEAALQAGARMAEPGEFTKRAFLNGKLDLAQAEAVNDLIRARTDAAQRVALRQLEGRLSARVRDLTSRLTGMLARIEASIDFPDDVPEPSRAELAGTVRSALSEVNDLLASAERGRVYREGARMVIAGRPNVGKSSLLNALLRESRAIVTPVPGTTRDVIEETINVLGVPIVAADTAGLRETHDEVERIGVERAEVSLETADLVLYVVDLAEGITEEDQHLLKRLLPRPAIVVLNKSDLADQPDPSDVVRRLLPEVPVVRISALTGYGLADLESGIADLLTGGAVSAESPTVSNLRHKLSLEVAARCLANALETLAGIEALDLTSGDLMAARAALGEITGETATEDILDRIFSEFCVGK